MTLGWFEVSLCPPGPYRCDVQHPDCPYLQLLLSPLDRKPLEVAPPASTPQTLSRVTLEFSLSSGLCLPLAGPHVSRWPPDLARSSVWASSKAPPCGLGGWGCLQGR